MPNVSFCEDDRDIHYNPYVEPPFFCKLTLNDGSVVNIEDTVGNGQLTYGMVSAYSKTCVSVQFGDLCTSIDGEEGGFYSFSNLTNMTISSSVTEIGVYALSECNHITSITIDNGNTVYDSRDNCNAIIESRTNNLFLGFQNTVIPDTVTTIAPSAFSYLVSLTSITIPNSVTSIGGSAFEECSNLASVTVKAVTPPSLGSYVFVSTNNCPIYVPSESVNTYKAAYEWNNYASRIQAIPTT